MATSTTRHLLHRRSSLSSFQFLRHKSSNTHDFSQPSSFIASWERPSDPREALARLDRMRKDYSKQVQQLRREYAYDVQMLNAEKERKEEARREVMRVANEERKAKKVEMAKVRVEEQKAIQEELRRTLLKERAQKLESWRAKEELKELMKKEFQKYVRLESSVWIPQEKLEDRIRDAIVDTTPL